MRVDQPLRLLLGNLHQGMGGELPVSAAATVGTCRLCFWSPETEAKDRKHLLEMWSRAVLRTGPESHKFFSPGPSKA